MKTILFIFVAVTLISSCKGVFYPYHKEVAITGYYSEIVEGHVNMTVDADTSADGIADIKNIPVIEPMDQIAIMVGVNEQFEITGTLIEYNDGRSNLERIYFGKK